MDQLGTLIRMATQSFWLLFGGIWFIVGLPFLLIGLWFAVEEYRLQTDSQVTQGVVLTKEVRHATRDRSTQYRVTYRFVTELEQVVTGSDTVSVDVWDVLREQGPVEVRYVASNPSSNRLTDQGDWVLPVVFLGFGLLFTPIGGFLFAKGLGEALSGMRIMRSGWAATGTITDIRQTNVSVNRRSQWVIHYRYRDHRGITHEGRSSYVSPDEAGRWQVGETGKVQYNVENPSKSVWLGR